MSDILHKSDFEPYANQMFTVHPPEGEPVEMELFELTENDLPGQESFSVIFKGPKEFVLPQMIYKFGHPKMGEVDLFLVPISYGKTDGMYYQAVFSRLIEE